MRIKPSKNGSHIIEHKSLVLLIIGLLVTLFFAIKLCDDPLIIYFLITTYILVIGIYYNSNMRDAEHENYISINCIICDKEYICGRSDMLNHTRLLVRDVQTCRFYIIAYMGVCELSINDIVCLDGLLPSNMTGADFEIRRSLHGSTNL